MKVVVQGQGEVSLTQKDFVASGGEGEIYAKGTTAFKVYSDPTRMLPVGKITELARIQDPNVIKPERVLLDSKGTPVGYTMRFISNTLPLCQTFTRAFREREGLDHAKMLKLVQRLRQMIDNVHRGDVLIVDLNEMNFLVDRAFADIFGIDVDSYQTKHYPATAIMPSVRDWTVQGHAFTEGSDWFSFACIAFQMLVGIHPYKGKHPSIQGLEERMQANVSVFDPAVSVPKVVYPFTTIPAGYLGWFKDVFQNGKRLAPPMDPGTYTLTVAVTRITSNEKLEVTLVQAYGETVLLYEERGGTQVAVTSKGFVINQRPVSGKAQGIAFTPKGLHVIGAYLFDGHVVLFDYTDLRSLGSFPAEQMMVYDGRVYIKNDTFVSEVILTETATGVIPTLRVVVNVLAYASNLYPGMLVQSMLGSVFVSLFPKTGLAYQVRMPDLDGVKIVDARFTGTVLMVVTASQGTFTRHVYTWDADTQAMNRVRSVTNITPAGLNFVVLDNGVCVHLTEEEKLEVFSASSPQKVRVVESPLLGGDMKLVLHGGRVACVRGDSVYSLRLK